MSGGWILWSAVALCERTKTSWQTRNLKMNEDLVESFWDMPCSRWEFGKNMFWLLKLKNQKRWTHQQFFSRRLNAKEVLLTPKRWRICFSCGRWFSKIIRKRLRIPRTHSETGIHCKERESQRRISLAIGKSFDLKNKKMTQKIGNNFGLFKDTSFIVIILNRGVQLTCREKNHSLFPRFTLLNETRPRRNIRCGRGLDTPKHLRPWHHRGGPCWKTAAVRCGLFSV